MIQAGNTTKSTTSSRNGFAVICVLAAVALVSPLAGCRGDRTDKPPRRFFPDMDYQPKLKAQSESEFFADGSSQREPVAGTVAFGSNGLVPSGDAKWEQMYSKDRNDMLKADETYYFGLVAGSEDSYVERMPVEVTRDLIERGKERFNIYCSMCHGYDGLGGDSGSVGRLMNVRPINLLDDKYRDLSGEFGSDGYLFHIVREGLWSPDGTNRMPAYGHAVNEQDAWAIVAYIRTLQKAFDAKGRRLGSNQGTQTLQQDEDQIASSANGGEG
ncbi:MAG: cytochrome c [Phycisphaerales bacterium]|nr:cytochrome c [Phycisphaerales bacterium]